MPRKVKPARTPRQETLDLVSRTVHEVMLERFPPTRWNQLSDDEIAALPKAEKLELMREELADIRGSLPREIRKGIDAARKSQSELYARKLRP
jgi:hypothetical protein